MSQVRSLFTREFYQREDPPFINNAGFLVQGNMACGVHKDDLIVRVGPAAHPAALSQPHTRLFDLTGKPMSGWVQVTPAGLATSAELEA